MRNKFEDEKLRQLEDALERISLAKTGNKAQKKIEIDHKRGQILHRYASVPIFDKFDYEQKLEMAINRNYLDNNYDYYLFKHNKTPEQLKE